MTFSWRGEAEARRGGRTVLASRSVLAAGIVASVVATAGTPARALELFGLHLFGEKETAEPVSPDAQRYETRFTLTSGDGALESRLKAASVLASEADGRPPPSTAAFLSRARADYGRLLAALYAEGHYGGTIAIEAGGRPVETIPADAKLPDPVVLTITVDPGPPFVFGRVDITGRPTSVPPQVQADIKPPKTPEDLGLRLGAPARAGAVTGAEEALVAQWRRIGHPKARIVSRTVTADHPNRRIDVRLEVDPGPAAVFGETTVAGPTDMDPAFVARQAGLTPGAPWSSDEVRRAEKRLQRLEVFGTTRIADEAQLERWVDPAHQPMDITVSERPLHVVGFGGSYSTVDGTGIEAYWQHRNLFGQAEKLRFDARISGIDGTDPSKFTYLGGFTFVKPGVLDPATDLTLQVQAAREVYDPYTEDRIRGRVGLSHEFHPGLIGRIAVDLETSRVDDAWGRRTFLFSSLPVEVSWDTTDDRLQPTTGFRIKGQIEPFYEARFGNAGAIGRLDASVYHALDDKGRHVLAARGAVGTIVGAPAWEIPDSRLFFAGGGGSVRGFAYRGLGPKLGNGRIVGGLSLAEASFEYRARVTDDIGIVPFVDMGSAFASRTPDFSEKLRIGAGLGLRWYTGLGAIRFDVAAPVNPDRGDPRFAVYIGIGEAF